MKKAQSTLDYFFILAVSVVIALILIWLTVSFDRTADVPSNSTNVTLQIREPPAPVFASWPYENGSINDSKIVNLNISGLPIKINGVYFDRNTCGFTQLRKMNSTYVVLSGPTDFFDDANTTIYEFSEPQEYLFDNLVYVDDVTKYAEMAYLSDGRPLGWKVKSCEDK